MTALARPRDEDRAPVLKEVAHDLLLRAVVPALVLIVAGLAVGWLLVVPLAAATGEDQVNVLLQAARTPTLDSSARIASMIGSVAGNGVICVLAVAFIWVVSRQWWVAVLPAIALQTHVIVHIVTSTLVGRPRPEVEHLDIGQPTTSFPSGHMGATTAQLLVVALFLCQRPASRIFKVLVVVLITGYLVWLGWSRLYLGMHHPSDVVWGAVNGVACGLIGWFSLRRHASEPIDSPSGTGNPPTPKP